MSLYNHIMYGKTISDNHDDEVIIASSEEYVAEISYQMPNKEGGIVVSVYPKEGVVPHLHVKSPKIKSDACIKIGKCEYFRHGGHQGTLNNTQAQIVDTILRLPNNDDSSITNYDHAVLSWQSAHPDWESKQTAEWLRNPQPDYSLINKLDK